MALSSQWKIALNRAGEAYFLIDRVNDPAEQCNLAADPNWSDLKDQLRLRILERLITSQRYITGSKNMLRNRSHETQRPAGKDRRSCI